MPSALALLMMQYVVIPCSQVANVGRMFVFGHIERLQAMKAKEKF